MESKVFATMYGMNLIQLKGMCLKLTTGIQKVYVYPNKRNRKTKKTFDYEGEDTGCTRALEDSLESFCIGTYFPIIDTLTAEVKRRKFVCCILQRILIFC